MATTTQLVPPGAEQHAQLRAAVDDYARLIDRLGELRSPLRHAHPWFGQLDLRGWHALAALHTTPDAAYRRPPNTRKLVAPAPISA